MKDEGRGMKSENTSLVTRHSSLASWFFDDPAKAELLISEARSWWGTPFAYFSRAKGPHGGIDCVGWCEEVTAAAGLERFAFERSETDYSRHVHNNKILNHLRGLATEFTELPYEGWEDWSRFADMPVAASLALAARWAELPVRDRDFTEPPMIGDLLIYKDTGRRGRGNGVFHMPLMISPTIFMQCAPYIGGVSEGQIDDPTYADHLDAHFRARATPTSSLVTRHSSLP